MGANAVDVSEQDFSRVVLEGSRERLVVVDFWAAWCGPCQVLKPVLEKLAQEYQGKFLLAKVDADTNQPLAMQHGVRGIPAVKAFLDGQVVDEFSGAMAEGYVRDFLDRNIPSPVRQLVSEAQGLVDRGDDQSALDRLERALAAEPDNAAAKVEKAGIALRRGAVAEAADLLDGLRGDILDYQRTQTILAKLAFAKKAQGLADEVTLQQVYEKSPDNLQAGLELATVRAVAGEYEAALSVLLDVLKRNPGFQEGAARKAMLSIFELLGGEGPLVQEYRRRMASALH